MARPLRPQPDRLKTEEASAYWSVFAEETPRRQEEMVDTVFGHQQLMWKKCVFYSRMGDADVTTPADRWVSVEKCTATASLVPLAAWPVPHLTSVGSKFSDQREAASHH